MIVSNERGKQKMKKILAYFLTIIMATSLLGACVKDEPGDLDGHDYMEMYMEETYVFQAK